MDLLELRSKINEIDDRFIDLFVQRMETSAKIGAYKRQNGINIYDPRREQEILDHLSERAGRLYAPYVQALYRDVFDLSRQLQSQLAEVDSIDYGLVGADVSYSYNKWIHHAMGNRSYGLYSLPEEMLPLLFERSSFRGINIASPYKSIAPQYCDRLDPIAEEAAHVNTIVREADGSLTGYDTEYDGILYAAKNAGIELRGKKILLLGNGAFAAAARKAAKDAGAAEVLTVSRTGTLNFRNYTRHRDADILINATSIGMNPDAEGMPADLSFFPNLCGVLDAVYTPVETRLIQAAKERNIPYGNGLTILIEKSARSSLLFGFAPDEHTCTDLYEELMTFIA